VLPRSLEVRSRLGYLPENVPVYPEMRVEEFLRFRALLKGVSRRALKSSVERALERSGCADMRRRMIAGLSKGYRQRVGLADAIVHDPPILILDEPTSGLDPNQRVEVRRLIAELGADHTVILSSHILAEVEAVAERVIIIHRGRIVANGTFASLTEELGGSRQVLAEVRGDSAAIDGALAGLRELDGVTHVDAGGLADGWTSLATTFASQDDRREDVARVLSAAGVTLRELRTPGVSLEDMFRRLTVEGAEVALGTFSEQGGVA